MEYIKIGRIVNVIGLKGEVKVYNYSDPDRYEDIDRIFIENRKIRGEERFEEYHVKSARPVKNMFSVKLKGVDDRDKAELLRERDIYISEEDLRELPEDTFYIRDLIGCRVTDIDTGNPIGEIKDVLQSGPQDIYEVKLENGNLTYIPAVREFIKNIDIEAKKVEVKLIPGFVEDAESGIEV